MANIWELPRSLSPALTSSTPQDLTLGGEATLGGDSTCLGLDLADLDMTEDAVIRPARREAPTYGGGARMTTGSVRRRSDTMDDSDDYNSLDMTARGRLPPCAPPLSPTMMLGNDYNSPVIRPFPR